MSDVKEIQLPSAKFKNAGGNSWACTLDIPSFEADSNEFPTFSSWQFYEDDGELGPAHSLHADIQELGSGKYSHWHNMLYMSASDNTSPRVNGRRYRLVKERTWALPTWFHKRLCTFLLRTHSLPMILMSLSIIGLCRVFLSLRMLLHLSLGGYASDGGGFRDFYLSFVEMFNEQKSGCLFSTIFMKFVERRMFRKYVREIRDPSLEIGVYNGVISILYFDYPFTMGTDLFVEALRKNKNRLPHKSLEYFNLIAYDDLPCSSYATIVMVHSIDDFTSPETEIAFRAFSHLLKQGGRVCFSGFTDYMKETCTPYKLLKKIRPEASFHEFRHIHETNLLGLERITALCSKVGLRVEHYEEFNKDPCFISIYPWENCAQKMFLAHKIRMRLWKLDVIRKIHMLVNSYIASFLLKREKLFGSASNVRGLNFFCEVQKL